MGMGEAAAASGAAPALPRALVTGPVPAGAVTGGLGGLPFLLGAGQRNRSVGRGS